MPRRKMRGGGGKALRRLFDAVLRAKHAKGVTQGQWRELHHIESRVTRMLRYQ